MLALAGVAVGQLSLATFVAEIPFPLLGELDFFGELDFVGELVLVGDSAVLVVDVFVGEFGVLSACQAKFVTVQSFEESGTISKIIK